MTRWNENSILPIQKLFAINPSNIKAINKIDHIWHIGRFAISKTEKEGAILLKRLIALAIYPICQDPNSIMLAECDKRFVRGLNLLGIKTEPLGPGITYLGSHTIPIYSKREWLQLFLEKSIYLSEAINIYMPNRRYHKKRKKEISVIS